MRLLSLSAAVLASLSLLACGGSSGASILDRADAAPPPISNGDGGDLVNGPGVFPEAAAPEAVCAPGSVSGFAPAWTQPEPWKQGACTQAQIADFYAACLTPPISGATCAAYVQDNGACATCLQSQDSASEAAAVVWHQNSAYWTVNLAGCIARATGDPSGKGCGAAYSAAIACRQQACSACWAAQSSGATFEQFATCESSAGGTSCSAYTSAVPTACGDLSSGPASVCMPPSSATAQQAFLQIAPLFCGQ